MKILVANNHLTNIGGSESFTYTLIEELVRRNHDVNYFTFHKGEVSRRIESDLGVPFMNKEKYDLILASHKTCVSHLFKRGVIIQTCHGIFSDLEEPSVFADFHVAISKEVQESIALKGFPSIVLVNGVNLDRFKSKNPINANLKRILSLCQSEEANRSIRNSIEGTDIELIAIDKNVNPSWEIENVINDVDLVIGIGRSLYDAMACGRPVIAYDHRHQYMDEVGDGYLKDKFYAALNNNCSGRFSKIRFTEALLRVEIQKYDAADGTYFRKLAEQELSIKTMVDNYLLVFEKLKKITPLVYLVKYLKLKFGRIFIFYVHAIRRKLLL